MILRHIWLLLIGLPLLAGSQETVRQYLSGSDKGEIVNWKFYCTAGHNSGKWTTIKVPSNWETEGFGTYNYGFAKEAARGKEEGWYEYDFNVPASKKGQQVDLVFEGVMTDAHVKINGKPAGPAHQGSYYIFRYDVSQLVNYGASNKLEVRVLKHSENESVNQAERRGDFWIFGGIFRPVYLEFFPQQHITSIGINAAADGRFESEVEMEHPLAASTLSVRVLNAAGKQVGATTTRLNAGSAASKLNLKVPSPATWTSETPQLYTAVFTLSSPSGQHTVRKKFGFRTVEVKQRDGVYINGVKVRFKGVNRHSFWPETGRTLTRARMLEDVRLMKSMNMNAVRLSHYPADEYFYSLCDSLGLYVMDELAGWHGHYDTTTGTRLATAMIKEHMFHPSIIFWANGNEGGHNRGLDHLFTELDMQHRPLIHPWEDFNGFDTQHYREYDYGVNNYMHGHSIVMPTEFLHGMYDGGHGAGLEDYWEAMWHTPNAAGGFLWDFADEGVVRRDKHDSIDTDGNHGADGIVGPHHELEGSYFAIREIWSPVKIAKKDITPDFDGSFELENRYFFRNLKDCYFTANWKKFDRSSDPGSSVVQSQRINGPAIKAGDHGRLKITLPANWRQADCLELTATDWNGDLICTWTWPLHLPSELNELKGHATAKPAITESDSTYHITSGAINADISMKNGILLALKNAKGDLPFNGGPVAQEVLNNFSGLHYYYNADTLIISSSFDKKTSYNTLSWKFYPNGLVALQVDYFPDAYFTSFQGVNFNLPEQLVRYVSYEGRGPYRVWKNRMRGVQYGVYVKGFNDRSTGEPPFKYPEFKGYYANLYWADFHLVKNSQRFKVSTSDEDLFLRLYTPRTWDDPYHNLQPVFPSGDISFMQGISGIGTKTQKTETTGPMGMKYAFYDYEKDPRRQLHIHLLFDFNPAP